MIIKKVINKSWVQPNPELDVFPTKIQQILATRNVQSLEALDYSLKGLLPPTKLKSIDKATGVLFDAIKLEQSILIIGDFDADGATSTAVLLRALKLLGAKKINYLVPDRFHFGYGLSVKLVEHAAQFNPDLIVTVDTGITNVEGVERANQLGISVIITDHHLASIQLPEAKAIVNPNQPGDRFESKCLAGVGVAFYLMLSLRSCMRAQGWFKEKNIDEPNLAELLDIVAVGTVADLVPLDKNNRIMVEQGLKRIRSGLSCAGIKALLQIAKRQEKKCQASDLGFAVGPRINAAGRLDDISIGIECLLMDDYEKALSIASKLDNLNRSRKNIEKEMLAQATKDIETCIEKILSNDVDEGQETSALCLYDPNWHQGVVGILASRVKEKINRPVIIFAQDDNQALLKGSARSIEGLHIRDILALIDSQDSQLIEKFGGHAMAAGLTIKQDNFPQFQQAFNEQVEMMLRPQDLENICETDGPVDESFMTIETSELFKFASPWGQLFPEPVFDDVFKVSNWKIVGEKHLKMDLVKEDTGAYYAAIAFNKTDKDLPSGDDNIRIVFRMDVNEFRGKRSLQLIVSHIEEVQ